MIHFTFQMLQFARRRVLFQKKASESSVACDTPVSNEPKEMLKIVEIKIKMEM